MSYTKHMADAGKTSFDKSALLYTADDFSHHITDVDAAIHLMVMAKSMAPTERQRLEYTMNLAICSYRGFSHFRYDMQPVKLIKYLHDAIKNFSEAMALAEKMQVQIPLFYVRMLYSAYGHRMDLYYENPQIKKVESNDLQERKKIIEKTPEIREVTTEEVFDTPLYSEDDTIA